MRSERPILVTGATGFVGRALSAALLREGRAVRCASRAPERGRHLLAEVPWVRLDVNDPATIEPALAGCWAAYYLVHSMGDRQGDYARREREAAQAFAAAAARAGLERIIYLGGIRPLGRPSKHLASRLAVGALLRQGPVLTIELRAAMIVGHGSESWRICRDLAATLPGMILPRWTRSRSEPVALDDVLVALRRALDLPLARSASYDLPGPEPLTVREILRTTARVLDLPDPLFLDVPVLSPRLSAYWLRLVTRADWRVARELVHGLEHDLLARDDRYWSLIGHPHRLPFEEAARRAIAAEGPRRPRHFLDRLQQLRRQSTAHRQRRCRDDRLSDEGRALSSLASEVSLSRAQRETKEEP
ncbi:MAG: NAD(P)H-binding protein [Chloroflexota bacterium]|nr:NAD(P)H-binding protein [Dehalococcoidia bacterium]MDW8252917.1 NAD(P)H-binding protein [Chloroflexota bacterium]